MPSLKHSPDEKLGLAANSMGTLPQRLSKAVSIILGLAISACTVSGGQSGSLVTTFLNPPTPASLPSANLGPSNNSEFSFFLQNDATTSAGVYTKEGVLLRTLWSGVKYSSGTHLTSWDGVDDAGHLVAPKDYDVKVLSNQVQYQWEGVVGNTSSASTGVSVHRAFQRLHGMAINGTTAYYTTNYNEQKSATHRFSLQTPQSQTTIMAKGATTANVATDGNLVYWDASDANDNSKSFVYATRVSDDSEVTNFTSGVAVTVLYSHSFPSAIDSRSTASAIITGLAVQKSGSFLFTARKSTSEIHVLNKTTGALIQNISIPSPQSMAVDKVDNLWVISGIGVTKYVVNAAGTLTAQFSLPGLIAPLAVAASPDGATVLVADGSTNQQVKAFDNTSGVALWTYGQNGGYANGPAVRDDKFWFADLDGVQTFLTFSPDGSFWVADSANDRIQHYSTNRTFIDRIMYLPKFYSSAVDSNNSTRAFANYLEFKIDYTKPLLPDNGSWALVNNWGYGIPAAYDDEFFRLRGVSTLSNGRTYAMQRHGNYLAVVELASAGMRITGLETADLNFTLSRDGSLRSVSAYGLGLSTQFSSRTLSGFDSSGNPVWSSAQVLASTEAASANDPAFYGAGNIVTTSSNQIILFDAGLSPNGGTGFHLGGIKIGDNHWSWKTAMSTFRAYSGNFPSDGSYDVGNQVQYGGSMAVSLDRNILWGYHGEFWKNSQVNKWTHVYDNGLFVGQLGVTGQDSSVLGADAPAMMSGNSFAASLVSGTDGNGYLYLNDESVHSGMHRWKITGLDTLHEQIIGVTLAQRIFGLRAQYFDGLDLNNAYFKKSQIEQGVSQTLSGSARWAGFIKVSSDADTTFYVSATDRVRLWLNNVLIIDQWSLSPTSERSSAPIPLKAAFSYPIRLEYASAVGGDISLKWSSSMTPKQIVPAVAMIPLSDADRSNGFDLHEGLAFNTVLPSGLYGWTRNALTEDLTNQFTQYWSVKTNSKNFLTTKSPDIAVRYAQASGASSVNRDLGLVPSLLTEWSVSGKINFDETNHSTLQGGVYLEVLDILGKVLVRFHVDEDWNGGNPILTGYGNSTPIPIGSKSLFNPIVNQFQSLNIFMRDGTASFTYANFPTVTSSLMDSTGIWNAPKILRLNFFTNGSSYLRVIDIDEFRFKSK